MHYDCSNRSRLNPLVFLDVARVFDSEINAMTIMNQEFQTLLNRIAADNLVDVPSIDLDGNYPGGRMNWDRARAADDGFDEEQHLNVRVSFFC